MHKVHRYQKSRSKPHSCREHYLKPETVLFNAVRVPPLKLVHDSSDFTYFMEHIYTAIHWYGSWRRYSPISFFFFFGIEAILNMRHVYYSRSNMLERTQYSCSSHSAVRDLQGLYEWPLLGERSGSVLLYCCHAASQPCGMTSEIDSGKEKGSVLHYSPYTIRSKTYPLLSLYCL